MGYWEDNALHLIANKGKDKGKDNAIKIGGQHDTDSNISILLVNRNGSI